MSHETSFRLSATPRSARTLGRRPRRGGDLARLLLLGFVLLFGGVVAQEEATPPGSDEGVTTLDEAPPSLASFGVSAGFPAYQTVMARAGIQTGFLGAELRVGYGSVASIGAVLQGYPPLPGLPVPVWIGAGAMASTSSVVPFAAVGAHVPLAQRVRLDVEGGVAWPRLGFERRLAPHLQVGVSYAFALPAPLPREDRPSSDSTDPSRPRDARSTCEAGPPRTESLGSALRSAERRFVDDARATYGSLYRSLSYSLRVVDTSVDGDVATLTLRYDGSVTEIASGERVSASGRAEATFRWNGCEWNQIGLSY